MSNSILYYPFIQVPNNDWLKTCILYYDEIGSIVPGRFGNAPGEFDEHMSELMNMKLVQRISPQHVLGDDQNKALVAGERFLEVVEYLLNNEIEIADESFLNLLNPYSGNCPDADWLKMAVPIYHEKFEILNIVCYDLHFRKLAWNCHPDQFREITGKSIGETHDIKYEYGWSFVDPIVGSAFMSFLASLMADKLGWKPITDHPFHLLPALELKAYLGSRIDDATFLSEYEQQKKQFGTDQIREKVLLELLPIPDSASFPELLDFKQKHGDKLNSFRNVVEESVLSIRTADEDDWEELIKAKLALFNDQKNSVIDLIKTKGFVEKLVNSGLWIANTVAASNAPLKAMAGKPVDEWDYFTFVAAMIGFGLLGWKEYHEMLKERNSSLTSPMTYSALFASQA